MEGGDGAVSLIRCSSSKSLCLTILIIKKISNKRHQFTSSIPGGQIAATEHVRKAM
jgi:hypothetical protein